MMIDRDHADITANADGEQVVALYRDNGFMQEAVIPDGTSFRALQLRRETLIIVLKIKCVFYSRQGQGQLPV